MVSSATKIIFPIELWIFSLAFCRAEGALCAAESYQGGRQNYGGKESISNHLCRGPHRSGENEPGESVGGALQRCIVLEEFDDNPFLREFYRDPEGVAFQTQVYFSRTLSSKRLLQQELFHPVTVCDYLFDKDRVFASMNLKDAELVYERIFSIVRPRTLKPDVVIYLHADVDVLMQRLKKRPAPTRAISNRLLTRLDAGL